MTTPVIALAGASGDLGGRIARALVRRGAQTLALVRPDLPGPERARLTDMGVRLAEADPTDADAISAAVTGATCLVSALNGVREVMIGRQRILLEGAIRAGVPRFVPSDFSADFTRTRPGDNRNFDLRREFMGIVDTAPIRATSILNGAFMDMLGAEMPIIQPRIRRVLYWHDADQPLDFTTKDDTAAYVAAVALDPSTPRILRIAGHTISAQGIARVMTEVTGERYRTLWAGGIGLLSLMIRATRMLGPGSHEAFPPWQGMQYMRDQFSGRGKLLHLDNDRYPDLSWTKLDAMLRARQHGAPIADVR